MQTGIIKFFNEQKNYGFITPDAGGTDIFFHGSKMKTIVKNDDPVEFRIEEGRKGPEAVDVDIIRASDEENLD